jgi:hypothetical protein
MPAKLSKSYNTVIYIGNSRSFWTLFDTDSLSANYKKNGFWLSAIYTSDCSLWLVVCVVDALPSLLLSSDDDDVRVISSSTLAIRNICQYNFVLQKEREFPM